MSEQLKAIIALFHTISSTLGVCHEDFTVMIEQSGRGTLLIDRIQESQRRLNSVIEALPHMTELLDAINAESEDADIDPTFMAGARADVGDEAVATPTEDAVTEGNAAAEPETDPEVLEAVPDEGPDDPETL